MLSSIFIFIFNLPVIRSSGMKQKPFEPRQHKTVYLKGLYRFKDPPDNIGSAQTSDISKGQFIWKLSNPITFGGISHSSGAFSQSISSRPVRQKKKRPLRPPTPDAPPDCTEEAAPSSMCSLEPPSRPGCTEEERGSSPHPLRQPRPQTQGPNQDTSDRLGTPRMMEGRSSVCRGKVTENIKDTSSVDDVHFTRIMFTD